MQTYIVAPEEAPEFIVVVSDSAENAALAVWTKYEEWHDYSMYVVDITGHEGCKEIGEFDNELFEWNDYKEQIG